MKNLWFARVRPLIVVAMLLSSLTMLIPAGVSAAQNDRGLIDDTSYQSPQFGYGVTWNQPWGTEERAVITNPGGFDTITLRSSEGTVRISGRSDDYNPLTFLQDTVAIQLASGGEMINQDTTGTVPTAELLIGGDKMRIDVVSLPEAGAVVLTSVRANEANFDITFASAQENIQLNDTALFNWAALATEAPAEAQVTEEAPPADPSVNQTPEGTTVVEAPSEPSESVEPVSTIEVLGSGIEGNEYTSPNFGFSVSWDPQVWSLPEEAEYSEPDYDWLTLNSETGPLWVTGWNAYNGDANTCLLGEMTYYNDPAYGVSEWAPAVDADGNELTGETENSAWGVYTNIYTDPSDPAAQPQNFVDYIECVSLGDGESVVIFYSYSTREDYNDHIGKVLAVVETLELPTGVDEPVLTPATEAPPVTPQMPDATSTPATETPTVTPQVPDATSTPSTLPETPSPTPGGSTPVTDLTGDDTVTGQTYAYSFAVPAGWQVNDSSLGSDIESTVLTNGTSTVTVEARALPAATLSDCVTTVASEHETQPIYADLALARTASGEAFSGEDDFSAFANFTFTGPEGETWAHFIECRWIVEGESVLLVIHDVPQDAFGSERSARRQIQNSIEIGQ